MTQQEAKVSTRRITTPEGLPLSLEIAPVGTRVSAIFLDLLIIFITLCLTSFLLYLSSQEGSVLSAILYKLFIFFLLNGYFIFFELYWRGATPGKRAVGIRVISSHGGPLTTSAVLARNLMRDLELYLPMTVLFYPDALFGPAPGAAVAIASIWIFIFLLMPVFNRDRARCGDLIAGTIVVVKPQGALLPDLTLTRKKKQTDYAFTNEQLQMYGIKELQVLEDVLRKNAQKRINNESRKVIRLVTEKIVNKIGWDEPIPEGDQTNFLNVFYKAQRKFLEQRLLMGERREKKKEGRLSDQKG